MAEVGASATAGMNTPAYFALDNMTLISVPEPTSVVLMLPLLLLWHVWSRRKRLRRGW